MFVDCSGTHGGFKCGESGDPSGTRRLLISRPAKRRSSHSMVMLAVWEVAPSCWNNCSSRRIPRLVQSVLQNLKEQQCNAFYGP